MPNPAVARPDAPEVSPRRMLTWTSGGSLASAIAAALTAGLLLLNTEVEVYGDFAVLVAIGFLLSNALRLGSDRMIVGEVRRSSVEQGRAVGQDLLAFSALMGLLGLVVIVVLPVEILLGFAQSAPLTQTETWIFAIIVAADTFRLTAAEALRARLRVVGATVASNGGRSVLFGLAILLAIAAVDGQLTRMTVLSAAAAASLLTGLIGWLTLRQDFRPLHGAPQNRVRTHWRGHAAMVGATVSTTVIAAADVWLVGLFISAAAAARYSLALSAVGLISIVLTASHVGIQPYLAERLGRGDASGAQELATKVARVGTVAAGLALLAAFLIGEPVAIALGGEEYGGVRWLILVLGLGVLSALAIGPASAGLTATARYAVLGRLSMVVAGFALLTEVTSGLITESELVIAFWSAASVTLLHASSWRQLRRLERVRTDALADVGS